MINLQLTKDISVDYTQIEFVRVGHPTGFIEIGFASGYRFQVEGLLAQEALSNLKKFTPFAPALGNLYLP